MGTTHRTADQWQILVNEQKASGLSAPKYCKQNNIAYASFSKWRKQLTKPTTTSESPAFIELTKQSQPEPQSWAVELALSDSIVLRIARA